VAVEARVHDDDDDTASHRRRRRRSRSRKQIEREREMETRIYRHNRRCGREKGIAYGYRRRREVEEERTMWETQSSSLSGCCC
jgi:hypothetical protein